MGAPISWETVVEWDVAFARSRRRAAARRVISARRAKLERRAVWSIAVAFVALAAVAVPTRLVDTAPAKSPVAKTTAPVVRVCDVHTPYRSAFRAAARETGLPVALLVAMAWEESRMDPYARSAAGAQGLLQLMPTTGAALGSRAYDPRTNIRAGARYLSRLLDRFDGNVELALAAYNAGPTTVEKLGRAPSLATLRYAKNVETRAVSLAACPG